MCVRAAILGFLSKQFLSLPASLANLASFVLYTDTVSDLRQIPTGQIHMRGQKCSSQTHRNPGHE